MIAEREALRMGIEHLTVLFPTEVSSFDFQVECTDRTVVQYKLNAQSLRLFGPHTDVNDAHRAGANCLQNKQTSKRTMFVARAPEPLRTLLQLNSQSRSTFLEIRQAINQYLKAGKEFELMERDDPVDVVSQGVLSTQKFGCDLNSPARSLVCGWVHTPRLPPQYGLYCCILRSRW